MFTKRIESSRIGSWSVLKRLRPALVRAALIGAQAFNAYGAVGGAAGADRPVPDERPATADRQAIEAVIRQQIDAFGHDDAERAFAIATPDIQRLFGSSDSFMRMVREHYEAVYRATGVQFERLALVDGQWVQAVRLTDDEGKVWRALFTMKRQIDRGWRVGGCRLVETSALST